MFLGSLIEKVCTKEENNKAGCTLTFRGQYIQNSYRKEKWNCAYCKKLKLQIEVQSVINATLDINLDFTHVRGHTGFYGNERAGFLANGSTHLPFTLIISKSEAFWKSF